MTNKKLIKFLVLLTVMTIGVICRPINAQVVSTKHTGLSQAQKQEFDEAFHVYSFIYGAENGIYDWCKNHYEISKYKQKISTAFATQKQKSISILKLAGKDWKEIVENLILENKSVMVRLADKEYYESQSIMNKMGINLSKKDYCKTLNDDPDWFVNKKKEMFEILYPGY